MFGAYYFAQLWPGLGPDLEVQIGPDPTAHVVVRVRARPQTITVQARPNVIRVKARPKIVEVA